MRMNYLIGIANDCQIWVVGHHYYLSLTSCLSHARHQNLNNRLVVEVFFWLVDYEWGVPLVN